MDRLTLEEQDITRQDVIVEKQGSTEKPLAHAKYFGALKFSEDGLAIQHRLRDEWNRGCI